jgi:gliding motility-associated-like protein
LSNDTALCSYGSILLNASHTYTNYLWSTGATAASIQISAPGTYWLQATDDLNCAGRDTILVSAKECLKGVYIPTAFTPNSDGRNDDFKPFIGGIVKQYRFTIYNRWGQVLFTTNNVHKGWDGNFGSTTQDANVFAWTCTYQLEGEALKVEKGTVVLIR